MTNESKHPGPWRWGDGWERVDAEGLIPSVHKYMDLQLYDGRGEVILSTRVDHYEPMWDTATEPARMDLPKPVRDLIAAAPDLLAAVKAADKALVSLTEFADGTWTPDAHDLVTYGVEPANAARDRIAAAIAKALGK